MNDTSVKRGIYNCPNCGAAATPESVRCSYCSSTLATLVCSTCYGAIFTGMKHCPWCGSDADAGSAQRKANLPCPRCAIDMELVQLRDHNLHECTSCGGLWVGRNTLQQICTRQEEQEAVLGYDLAHGRTAESPPHSQARMYIPCPECGKFMNRNNFGSCSGVIVDWCKAHGTWFDRAELKRIVLFIRGGGLKKARERDRTRLEEEKQHLREERRSLARIARLGEDPSLRLSSSDDTDAFFDALSSLWNNLSRAKK